MKVISIFIICALFINCTNSDSNTKNGDSTTVNASAEPSDLDKAKQLSKSIIDYVEQADMNQISTKMLGRKADPLQLKLDSLRSKLNPTELKELDAYRTKLMDDMAVRRLARQAKS